MLLHPRQIPADTAKSGDPRRTMKGASKLLLIFGPAKVLLGLVVILLPSHKVLQSYYFLDVFNVYTMLVVGE